MTNKNEFFYASEDVARYLGVNLDTARRLMRTGKVPAVRIGRRWYCPRAAFDELFLASK